MIARVNAVRREQPGAAAQRAAALPPTSTTTQLLCLQQDATDDRRRRRARASSTSTRTTRSRAGSTSTSPRSASSRDRAVPGARPARRARATRGTGPRNYVELDPHVVPAHVFRVRRQARPSTTSTTTSDAPDPRRTRRRRRAPPTTPADGSPLWYKDAIIYEVHVRAFFDSERRRHRRLPRADLASSTTSHDLGVTAIWLLPFYPSPLRDDGYDIADYRAIHPAYGTLRDFQRVPARGARARAARDHRARAQPHVGPAPVVPARAPRAARVSRERDFYVWSDTPDRYADARIIFKDFETSNWTWDPVAERVLLAPLLLPPARPQLRQPRGPRRRCFAVVDFWLEMGVDGLRLDAVPYLFEREGTNCENLPETHDVPASELRAPRRRAVPRPHAAGRGEPVARGRRRLLRRRRRVPHGVPLPADAADVHGDPAWRTASRSSTSSQQTPPIPDGCQWAIFLRNHDELTLEMVTDEERDYMYRVYAAGPAGAHQPRHPPPARAAARQRPAADRADERPALLAAGHAGHLLRRRDRHGRQHLPRRPQRRAHADAVERRPQRRLLARQPAAALPAGRSSIPSTTTRRSTSRRSRRTPHSLLWWMKRLIALRKRYRAFGRGTIEFLQPDNRKVLAFLRHATSDERILVVANLSRFAQYVELDLSRSSEGMAPVELFGGVEFPRDRRAAVPAHARPARLLLVLARAAGRDGRGGLAAAADRAQGALAADRRERAREGGAREALPAWLLGRRWFGAKARRMRSAAIADVIRVPDPSATGAAPPAGYLVLVRAEFTEGDARPTSCRSRRRRSRGTPSTRFPARRSPCCTAPTASSCCTRRCTSRPSRGRCSI